MIEGPSTAALIAPAAGVFLVAVTGYGYALFITRDSRRRARKRHEAESQPAE